MQQAATEKEMALLRHYESVLQSSDGRPFTQTYNLFTLKLSLERLTTLLRLAIKAESEEDTEGAVPNEPIAIVQDGPTEEEEEGEGRIRALDQVLGENLGAELESLDLGLDWAAERETEIERLEKENMELRRQLGILRDPDEKDPDRDSNLFGQRHNRTVSAPFGSGFITSTNMPSPQASPLITNPYSPGYPGAQGYTPPPNFSQPERRIGLPGRGGPLGPAPPQITARNTFAEGTFGGRQGPAFPNFFRGPPPARDRMDLAGGQPPLL